MLLSLLLLLAACGNKEEKKEETAMHKDTAEKKTTDQTKQQQQTEKTNEQKSSEESKATETNQSDSTTTKQQQQQGQSEAKAPQSTKTQTKQQDSHLASQIALAFFGNNIDNYAITKDEIVKGVYTYQGPGMTKQKRVDRIKLQPVRAIPNAPKGMTFYSVIPEKGNFATIIGVNEDKVFVGGTQGALVDYQKLLTSGKEMNIHSLYEAHKNDPALEQVTHKIQFTN